MRVVTNSNESISEGIGFGMLITVYMADSAVGKADFDGLLRYYRSKEKTPKALMNWRISAAGAIIDGYVAPDGDIDAAYALLVADKKWGSGGGNPNYKAEAVRILNGLQAWVVLNRGANDSKLVNQTDMSNTTHLETLTDNTMSS
ncbi:glycosyl hydrolase family 8 [Massilia glaciei]|nr:glycosyl hydrolase family 8 [Massilia glaciei]